MMRSAPDALQVLMQRREDAEATLVENHATFPCDHCASTHAEDQMRQCWNCQGVYCGCCSVANFDERYDRAFCLDCHQAYTRRRTLAWSDALRARTRGLDP